MFGVESEIRIFQSYKRSQKKIVSVPLGSGGMDQSWLSDVSSTRGGENTKQNEQLHTHASDDHQPSTCAPVKQSNNSNVDGGSPGPGHRVKFTQDC